MVGELCLVLARDLGCPPSGCTDFRLGRGRERACRTRDRRRPTAASRSFDALSLSPRTMVGGSLCSLCQHPVFLRRGANRPLVFAPRTPARQCARARGGDAAGRALVRGLCVSGLGAQNAGARHGDFRGIGSGCRFLEIVGELPLNSGLLLHRPIRYARGYTPSTADLPRFPVDSAQRRSQCVRPWGRPRPRNISIGVSIEQRWNHSRQNCGNCRSPVGRRGQGQDC